MIMCPNTNHKDWKDIVNKYGEDVAYASYIAWGEEIPSLQEVDNYIQINDLNPDVANIPLSTLQSKSIDNV